MFAKRILQKATHHHHNHHHRLGTLKPDDVDPHIRTHLGVPSTASILAVDRIQRLLAIGTLDGRIKVIGGDNIEGLLISPKQMPYKYLEFLENRGYLVGISNDNELQVWNLERRSITYSLQWESNITAFSVISGSLFMFVGDEHGLVSVIKFADDDDKLRYLPYHISPEYIVEKAGISFRDDQPVVGVLPQPCSFGNRLLIAYQYGLIVLWDISEGKVVVFKGDKDLQVKDDSADSASNLDTEPLDDGFENMQEKEISALCWASSCGSILAVGYVDGDILLWNVASDALSVSKKGGLSCNDIVKIQLASTEKRLPVIVLRWSEKLENVGEGQLYVYGGNEIGSEEVITIVSLHWSHGLEALKSVRRVDLSLIGSFADMILLSSLAASAKSHFDGLFVLTSPGKLQFYAAETMSSLAPHPERKLSVSGIEPAMVVPICNPQITSTKLSSLPCDVNWSAWLSELSAAVAASDPTAAKQWPLTGGIQHKLTPAEDTLQKQVYIVGYQDGSVRLWDASNPVLSLLSVLEGQVYGTEVSGPAASVTKLDFCAAVRSLAVGTECGVVRVYDLNSEAESSKLHLIKQSKQEVIDVPPRKGPQCIAEFSFMNSPVRSLQFSSSGTKLAVGFESSHVAMLDMVSLSVLFVTDMVSSTGCPVISVNLGTLSDAYGLSKGSKKSGSEYVEQPTEELLFILTKDAKIRVISSKTGTPISSLQLKKEAVAVSMYVLECGNPTSTSLLEQHEQSSQDTARPHESTPLTSPQKGDVKATEHSSVDERSLMDTLLLLCCENIIRLYDTKSVIKGEDKPILKVKLPNTSCWTSIVKKDGAVCGLIVCYNSGVLEVRTFPDLAVVKESSIMEILRWNVRPKIEKMSATDNGQICLADRSELAFFSVSSGENGTRFLDSLPLLHDKVVAAAADAAILYSKKQTKEVAAPGLLGGIVKGFKKEKVSHTKEATSGCKFSELEQRFSHPAISDASQHTVEDKEEELDIDDIEIDEPILITSTSSHPAKARDSATDRERLFHGTSADTKPRTRTPQEIMAKYRGTEYAAAAAENAKIKLLERQEKLERLSKRTEDLRDGAEDFASLAHELAKTMEGRKWWKI